MSPRVVIGAILGVVIGAILYSVFGAKDETPTLAQPAPAPTRTVPPAQVVEGELNYPAPKAGPNPALARAQQLGKLVPGDKPLQPKVPDSIGTPTISPPPRPSAAQAGDAITPGKPWPIDREGIKGAVNEALPEIKECYEEWLKVSPKLGGKVVVTFTIKAVEGQETGKVTEVALSDQSTIGHKPMENCVLSVVEDLRFARPADGEIKVTYPMQLANGELDAGTR